MMVENLRRALLPARGDWIRRVTRPILGRRLDVALLSAAVERMPATGRTRVAALQKIRAA